MSDGPQAAPAPAPDKTGALKIGMLRPGTEVLQGRFKVLELLGRGGMGDVYLAEQVSLGRKVALKTLREDLSLQPGMTERFKREARLLSTVDHPSIVRVIDFGEAEGAYVLVMEFVEGDNLASEVRQGALDPPRALSVMKDIADGLAAIHAQGIIHRDLKPDNVLLTRVPEGERARLLDFGIARLAEEEGAAAMTQAGLVLGTPEYLSPEQATGARVDARSDVYAFGVLAYRLLAGRHPFLGPSARDYLLQHITQAPPELASVAPHLSDQPALLAFVMSCLSKEPATRPDGGKGLVLGLAKLSARPVSTVALRAQPTPAPVVGAAANATGVIPAPAAIAPTVPSKQASVTGSSAISGRAKNLAVVLIDIKGFAELSATSSHEDNAKLQTEHHRMFAGPLKALGGHLVHRWQDRAVATFESPTAAVQFGMTAQDAAWRYNASAAPERKLAVSVAIHVGEVVVTGDSIVGEPAQLVTEAANTTASGEVVFTQAVWLSMNKVGVPAEPRGALALPGRADLALYRCTPSADGAPFGGRDLQTPTAGFDASALVIRGRTIATTAMSRLSRLDRKVQLGAAGGVLVLGLALWLLTGRDPTETKAGALLDQGLAPATLELLDASKRRNEPPLKLLKGEAFHQLKKHREEWDLVRAGGEALDELRPSELAALMEDFVKNDRDEALRAALGKLPSSQLKRLKKWATGSVSTPQWGAVRYLDIARVPDSDLVAGYIVALDSTDCDIVGDAAKRLGELGDTKAIGPLERVKSAPRKQVLFFAGSCGHDEADASLEKLNGPRE
jgi:serine/threonine protein kinase, bacterial